MDVLLGNLMDSLNEAECGAGKLRGREPGVICRDIPCGLIVGDSDCGFENWRNSRHEKDVHSSVLMSLAAPVYSTASGELKQRGPNSDGIAGGDTGGQQEVSITRE